MLERVYSESIGYPILNGVGTGLMAQLSNKFPGMNIIEVGAGTGGSTAAILALLGNAYASYTFTDISSGFFERAGERLREYTHKMEFKTLDITKEPAMQGFAPQGYDVVVALQDVDVARQHLGRHEQILGHGTRNLVVDALGRAHEVVDEVVCVSLTHDVLANGYAHSTLRDAVACVWQD
jgi:ubiquinone/menaquinone biosynthesis C-methylase UbiE